MCEELEYSDLLDLASENRDVYMRMVLSNLNLFCLPWYSFCVCFQVLVACFAISRYAASIHRGQRKPFNPLEGETYENKREDLGWNYVAEQVSPANKFCLIFFNFPAVLGQSSSSYFVQSREKSFVGILAKFVLHGCILGKMDRSRTKDASQSHTTLVNHFTDKFSQSTIFVNKWQWNFFEFRIIDIKKDTFGTKS